MRVTALRQSDASSEAFSKRCLIHTPKEEVGIKGQGILRQRGYIVSAREREGRMSKGEEKRRRREPSTLSDGDHRYRCRDDSFDAWTKRSKEERSHYY